MSSVEKISIEPKLMKIIAIRATQIAREKMTQRGWKSGASISPVWNATQVGIKPEVKYLLFQERGIKPYVMWRLEGKMIPIKGPDGKIHLIKATRVGQPGWVFIPGRGRVWRDQRWRHPGLKPQNIMKDSLRESISENRNEIVRSATRQLQLMVRGQLL